MKPARLIIFALVLLVGLRVFTLRQKWSAPSSPHANPVSQASTESVRYTTPIPDPDSDILFVRGNQGLGVIRFSPEKGFWGEEPNILNDASGFVVHANALIVASILKPFPSLITYDLLADRPYANTGIVPVRQGFGAMAFQPHTGRLFMADDTQVDVFRAGQKSLSIVGTISVPFQLGPIFSSPDEERLYICEINAGCYLLDVPDHVGAPTQTPPTPLTMDTPVLSLAFTRDGKTAVSIDRNIEDETKTRISVYRVNETGDLRRLPGSPYLAKHRSVTLTISPSGSALYLGYAPTPHSIDHTRGLDIYSLDSRGKIASLASLPDGPRSVFFGAVPGRAFGQVDSGVIIAYGVDAQTGLLTKIARSTPYGYAAFVLSPEKNFPRAKVDPVP